MLSCVSTNVKPQVSCITIYVFAEFMPLGNSAQCLKKCYFFTLCISNFIKLKEFTYAALTISEYLCLLLFWFSICLQESLSKMYTERTNDAFLQPASSCKMAVLMLCQKLVSKTSITVEDKIQSFLLFNYYKLLTETSGGNPFSWLPNYHQTALGVLRHFQVPLRHPKWHIWPQH